MFSSRKTEFQEKRLESLTTPMESPEPFSHYNAETHGQTTRSEAEPSPIELAVAEQMAQPAEPVIPASDEAEMAESVPMQAEPMATRRQEPSNIPHINQLMQDDSINDILINGAGPVYVERAGILEATNLTFQTTEEVLAFAQELLKSVEREIDPKRPMIDTRLEDGSRVNIILPPMAVDGAHISIRKFPAHQITLDSMVQTHVLTEQVANFLKACAQTKLNMVISGGTGAGKTTMLNALSQYINRSERIVTIEDSAELQLQQPHVVRLETKEPTSLGDRTEEVNIRDLTRNALRMRPDRIILGEVRGAEAFDMLQAMNCGHEGSLATMHANSPRDAIMRLENMVDMGEMHLSQKFIRQQIVSALSIILQVNRFKDGSRRLTNITEVVGLENDTVVMQDLFTFQPRGEDENGRITGQFQWLGVLPRNKDLANMLRKTGVFK